MYTHASCTHVHAHARTPTHSPPYSFCWPVYTNARRVSQALTQLANHSITQICGLACGYTHKRTYTHRHKRLSPHIHTCSHPPHIHYLHNLAYRNPPPPTLRFRPPPLTHYDVTFSRSFDRWRSRRRGRRGRGGGVEEWIQGFLFIFLFSCFSLEEL